jgi:hypothetical protein
VKSVIEATSYWFVRLSIISFPPVWRVFRQVVQRGELPVPPQASRWRAVLQRVALQVSRLALLPVVLQHLLVPPEVLTYHHRPQVVWLESLQRGLQGLHLVLRAEVLLQPVPQWRPQVSRLRRVPWLVFQQVGLRPLPLWLPGASVCQPQRGLREAWCLELESYQRVHPVLQPVRQGHPAERQPQPSAVCRS